jgi:hypothetical protein
MSQGLDATGAVPFGTGRKSLLELATNVIFNAWITDVYTCFKLMPTELMRSLPPRADGFTIEAELTAPLLRPTRGLRVPISYVSRRARGGEEDQAERRHPGPVHPVSLQFFEHGNVNRASSSPD